MEWMQTIHALRKPQTASRSLEARRGRAPSNSQLLGFQLTDETKMLGLFRATGASAESEEQLADGWIWFQFPVNMSLSEWYVVHLKSVDDISPDFAEHLDKVRFSGKKQRVNTVFLETNQKIRQILRNQDMAHARFWSYILLTTLTASNSMRSNIGNAHQFFSTPTRQRN